MHSALEFDLELVKVDERSVATGPAFLPGIHRQLLHVLINCTADRLHCWLTPLLHAH